MTDLSDIEYWTNSLAHGNPELGIAVNRLRDETPLTHEESIDLRCLLTKTQMDVQRLVDTVQFTKSMQKKRKLFRRK